MIFTRYIEFCNGNLTNFRTVLSFPQTLLLNDVHYIYGSNWYCAFISVVLPLLEISFTYDNTMYILCNFFFLQFLMLLSI